MNIESRPIKNMFLYKISDNELSSAKVNQQTEPPCARAFGRCCSADPLTSSPSFQLPPSVPGGKKLWPFRPIETSISSRWIVRIKTKTKNVLARRSKRFKDHVQWDLKKLNKDYLKIMFHEILSHPFVAMLFFFRMRQTVSIYKSCSAFIKLLLCATLWSMSGAVWDDIFWPTGQIDHHFISF